MLAKYPAPKPLSILTTATPGEHEFSIVSSGAIPLNPIFAEIRQKKILVVGDVMLDEFVLGNVERMSPEAPVPVINVKEIRHALGGAANTANNISALGAKAIVAGIIGNDAEGKMLRKLIANAKIDSSCLLATSRKTTKKNIRHVFLYLPNRHLSPRFKNNIFFSILKNLIFGQGYFLH